MSAALSARLARLADPATDTELLARFAAARDGAAFAELARRHGPMVLAVCRRVTRHAHDAEDAFQAAFLVLARKADRLGPRDRVAAWLYGVALRTARKACERRGREALVAAVPDVPEQTAEAFDPDAARAVVEEVGRLPGIFRAAVVLCELEGRPRAAAARELGIAEGTLSSRLALARKRLAARLAARGFGPTTLAALVGAAVPPRLATAASALSSGGPAPSGVAALAHGVSRSMALYQFRAVPAAVVLAVVVAIAAGPSAGRPDVLRPAPAPHRVAAQPPIPEAKVGPVGIVVARGGVVLRFAPDGKKLGEIAPPKGLHFEGQLAVSSDGTRLAVAASMIEPEFEALHQPPPLKLVIVPLAGGGEPKVVDLPGFTVEPHWMFDGKALSIAQATNPGRTAYRHATLTPGRGEVTSHGDGNGLRILDVMTDGMGFLCEQRDAERKTAKLVLTRAGGVVRPLTDLKTAPGFITARLSPDGTKVLFIDGDPTRKDAHRWGKSHRPYVLDLETKTREPLGNFPENGQATGVCWAPDGKRVAYTWVRLHADLLARDELIANEVMRETEGFVAVADADGRNAKTVARDKSRAGEALVFGPLDWR